MISLKRLLIDLDGTLTASPEIPLAVRFTWKTVSRLRRFGGWTRALKALAAVKRAMERHPDGDGTPSNSIRAARALAHELRISEKEALELLSLNATEFLLSERNQFKPVPGALDFLDWARPRYPLTLATNPVWLRPEVELRVRWGGVDPSIFDQITTADQMVACKPHAAYYQQVLSFYPGITPSDTIMIGNDPVTDLAAARIGIPVFLLSNRSTPQKLNVPGLKAPAWTGNYGALKTWLSAAE
jgi:FMN phosphatase YigB (HAD superfamily)